MSSLDKKEETSKVGRKDILKFALHYWKPRKKWGISAASLMFLAVAVDAIVPVFTGKIVDAMVNKAGLTMEAATGLAWRAFMFFALLSLLQLVLRQSSVVFWNRFAVGNLYSIVTDGIRKVQRFSSDWHANAFAGGTVRKITRGMWAFDQFEDVLLMGLLPATTIMIGVTVTLSLALPQIGIIVAVMILLYCGVSIWMAIKILAPRHRDSAAADTKIGATLSDIITGNATVKAFAAENREEDNFNEVANVWYKMAIRAWQTSVGADTLRSILRLVMMTLMISATIYLWNTGKASAGDIVVVITSFFVVSGYLHDIGRNISQLQRSASDMEDVIGFWLREDDVVDVENAKDLQIDQKGQNADLISFKSVEFKYPNTGKVIYQDMSIDIKAGENLALVGPSGSGKSTFIKLIQRLYNVTDGAVYIAGQDISQVTLESLRRSIALVPQDPILFHRSLAENIAYGKPGASRDEIIAAAKKAYAHDFIEGLPQGYDTLVGERGIKLSGGERQRVAIARAILSDAPILILDEATSSLDSISEHYIKKALQTLMEGRTTITIAHRLSTIQNADRILVFDFGAVIEQGKHAELMMNPQSRYKALYDMQALDLVG